MFIYMVTSQINPQIFYGKDGINEDLDHTSTVYELEVLGKNIEIVLGIKKEKEDLSYFITYVILENNKVRPIGIFEKETKDLRTALDDDGDINIDEMTGPLLFDNVELSQSRVPHDDGENEPDQSIPPPPDEESEGLKVVAALEDASRSQEKKEEELVTTGIWIKQFMQNKNYAISDNEGGGDCLFSTIRDGFRHINKQYTVGDLRKLLCKEATQTIFENYKALYDSFNDSIKKTKAELKMIADENNELKLALPKEENTTKQRAIVARAKKLKEMFVNLKNELAISKEMLDEQAFMTNVTSLEQFKAIINTRKFWGDTWAISTLERVLNTKFILLSEESFLNNDVKNVLQCGQLNDTLLEEKKIFTPDFYIIMDYTGSHYKLVTYKDHGIFTFRQLPFGIRDLITDKCLERMAGPYAIIPEFVQEKLATKEADISSVTLINADPETEFMFYNRSNHKPLPGRGVGEKIQAGRREDFKKLATFKDWRRKLSNEWISPIDVDGHQWNSVEHYYQGSKYKDGNPEIYYQFTLDSRSELGKSVDRAKRFKDREPDIEFFGKRQKKVICEGLDAKFNQHMDLRNILTATLDATLTEYRPKQEKMLATELMNIRKNLTK